MKKEKKIPIMKICDGIVRIRRLYKEFWSFFWLIIL